jgi:tripartite-type tricarboxylate transporter receptor subunit TctC
MRKRLLSAVAALIACAGAAQAQSVEDFYKGREVEFISTGAAGTTYDLWARLLGTFMSKLIPGHPTFVVRDMPGAGHIRGANHLYSVAPRDGSVIAMTSDNVAVQTVLKNKPGLDIDYTKFAIIGRTDAPIQICLARKGAKVQKAEDLFTETLIMGGAGAGSGPSIHAGFIKATLGMKMKIVDGYKSLQDIFLAIDRGEVEGACTTTAGIALSRPDAFKTGYFKLLFKIGNEPLPGMDAPSIRQFAKTDEQRQIIDFYSLASSLGHMVIAPPGVPRDRVDALRAAFDATVKDPEFLKEAKRQKLSPSPGSGVEWERTFEKVRNTPPEIIAKVAAFF